MFGRSYQPKFSKTVQEYMKDIKEKIRNRVDGYVIVENDAPYDTYLGKLCETHHLTMFYNDTLDPYIARQIKRRYLEEGYSNQEMSDTLKSVPLDHMHFIKLLPTHEALQHS